MINRETKLRQILGQLNARHLWYHTGPPDTQIKDLNAYYIPNKGVLIIQTYKENDGFTTFADWPTGVTWAELGKILEIEISEE